MKILISLFMVIAIIFVSLYMVVYLSPLLKNSKTILYKVITVLAIASLFIYVSGAISFLILHF